MIESGFMGMVFNIRSSTCIDLMPRTLRIFMEHKISWALRVNMFAFQVGKVNRQKRLFLHLKS